MTYKETIHQPVTANAEKNRVPSDCEMYQGLWRAVILQHIIDASSRSNKPEAIAAKREAWNWLTGDSEDFHDVCNLANLAPAFVREHAMAILSGRRPPMSVRMKELS